MTFFCNNYLSIFGTKSDGEVQEKKKREAHYMMLIEIGTHLAEYNPGPGCSKTD